MENENERHNKFNNSVYGACKSCDRVHETNTVGNIPVKKRTA